MLKKTFGLKNFFLDFTENKCDTICLMKKLTFQYSDGGRSIAGYYSNTGDCVVRALANTLGSSYMSLYEFSNKFARANERNRRIKSGNVYGWYDETLKKIMRHFGFKWVAKRTSVKTPLQIPRKGKVVVSLMGHVCAVVDGVILDTHNPINDLNLAFAKGYWIMR